MKQISTLLLALALALTAPIPVPASVFQLVDDQTTTGKSAGVPVDTWQYKGVYVTFSGTATVKVEIAGTDTDSKYVQIGNDITSSPAAIATDNSAGFIRINVTACSACSVDAELTLTN